MTVLWSAGRGCFSLLGLRSGCAKGRHAGGKVELGSCYFFLWFAMTFAPDTEHLWLQTDAWTLHSMPVGCLMHDSDEC